LSCPDCVPDCLNLESTSDPGASGSLIRAGRSDPGSQDRGNRRQFTRKARELNPHSSGPTELGNPPPNTNPSTESIDRVLRKTIIKQLVTLVISSSLVACASSEDRYESAGDPVTTRGHDCISQSTIRDYQVLDDKNLIVTAGGKRKYHAQLSRNAFGLRSNWNIGFRSSTGRICSGTGEVVVGDSFGNKETIRISSIKEVGPDELNALLVQFGKKVPEVERTPAQEEVNGAEVEELD